MNYEKAYKDSLNKAKSKIWNDKGHVLYEDDIVDIFPEIVESEDEMIRKEIIKYLIDFNNGTYKRPNENIIDTWIAWLEKQGEQKFADILEDFERLVEHLLSLSDGEGHGSPAKVKEVSSELLRLANQQKSSWSEKDEKMWAQVINEIEAIKSNSSTIFEKNIAQDKIDWLKSLKYRIKGE